VTDYEAWRPALIAFYRAQGPWFMTIEQLERGAPLTTDNKHDIDGLVAAMTLIPMRQAA
jgi:hypothetical protein